VRRLTIAAALLAVLAGPALAQRKPYSAMNDQEKAKQKEVDAVDQQYRSTLKKTDKETAETPIDPWSNMREPSDAKKKR